MPRIPMMSVVSALAGAIVALAAILVGTLVGDGREGQHGRLGADTAPDQELSLPLPRLEVVRADGRSERLLRAPGRPMLIDLWATWCGPCIAEMPVLARLATELEGRARIVGVVTDGFEAGEVDERIAERVAGFDLPYPNYFATGETFRDLEAAGLTIRAVPTKLLLDPEGRVRYIVTGGGRDEVCRRLLLGLAYPEESRDGEGVR